VASPRSCDSTGQDPPPAQVVGWLLQCVDSWRAAGICKVFADKLADCLDRTCPYERGNSTTFAGLAAAATAPHFGSRSQRIGGLSGAALQPRYRCGHRNSAGLGLCIGRKPSRARLIHQIVEASGGPELLKATRFIQHGENENYWKTFAGVLSQIDRDDRAIANAASAAQTAFECFLEAARLQRLAEVTDSSQQRPA